MSRGHDADAGIGRLVGKAVHERPLRVFWRSGRYGVGHRFDADAKLDLVSCRRSMDVSLMGGLVVWLAGPFTNGPYRFFCVLGGLVLAIGLMQMPSWIWWRRVGQWMCGVDGGIGRLVGRAVHERPYRCFGVLGGVACGEVGDNLMIVVRLDR